jgi:hypothetical protein
MPPGPSHRHPLRAQADVEVIPAGSRRALAPADIDPLIALLRQIQARAAASEALRNQAAAVLREYAADGALPSARPGRPVPIRTLRAQTWDDRSRPPNSLATLLVQYFEITTGTCCPPDERFRRKCANSRPLHLGNEHCRCRHSATVDCGRFPCRTHSIVRLSSP